MPHGLTLGHLPQSWERSTVGGWVAARSAGQESIGFGRIEALFAGGRLVAPAGTIDLPPHPASAAGPDLRQLVLGSEGRFGVLTRATVRAVAKPRVEGVPAWFLGEWPRAVEAAREIARAGLPLSMVRLATPIETATTLALAGESRGLRALRGYLRMRRIGPEPCLLLVIARGEERIVETAAREVGSIVRRHGGTGVGGSFGRQWLRTRFRAPDLRDALWDLGYAVDTLETAIGWARLPDLAAELGRTLRHGLDERGERVHAFSHLSHVYPSGSSLYATCVFRIAADPDETLERWRVLKTAASEMIVRHGGTISHQHGVGRDHRPWLAAEKGELGLDVLTGVARAARPGRHPQPGRAPAMSADHLLALDVGTQSVRALVFDPRGELVARGRIPIEPYVSPQPGWAEQDPDLYWRAIGDACAALWAGGVARPDAIAGVTLTTQRATVVVTDAAGAPLRPAIVWLDQRRAEGVPEIGGVTGLAFRALRVRRTVAAFQADCEANWLQANEPATWSRIGRYLLLSGFLAHRLTGRFVDSLAAQVGYVPFDSKALAWAKPGDWRWQAAPIDPAWLPELVPPGGRLGELTAEAAGVVGLPAGTPVVAAAADKACEVIGSGALEPDIASLSYGTTATINTTQTRYVEAVPLVPPYPSAVPGAWSLEVQVYRGYWLVDWFKRQFGAHEVAQAEGLGVEPEALFDDLVRADRAGLDGPRDPADLDARRPRPGPRGEGRDDRLRRRPHPGPRLPGDPRGPRVRAARGRRARRGAGEDAAPRAADLRRRRAVAGRGPADGRHLRPAHRPAPHPRDVRARGGDRRRGRARDPPVVPGRGRRHDAARGDDRPGPGAPPPVRGPVPAGLPADVRAAEAAVRGDHGDHRLPAALSIRGGPVPGTAPAGDAIAASGRRGSGHRGAGANVRS